MKTGQTNCSLHVSLISVNRLTFFMKTARSNKLLLTRKSDLSESSFSQGFHLMINFVSSENVQSKV